MNAANLITVSAFYKFVELTADEVNDLMAKIESYADVLGVRGLILLAKEGINATIAGRDEAVETFKLFLRAIPAFSDLDFKDSPAQKVPFRRLVVQFRDEIVTLKTGIGIPPVKPENRLSPKAWDAMLRERRHEISLIDVRNDYEVEIGKFRGAMDPKLKRFSQFPEYVRSANLPKDKPVLMYCTGGIRCEKAIQEMYTQGFEEVYQLDGGILKYFEECPESEFEGECFVFDHRVAVDQQLNPTKKFKLCPHCGNPGTETVSCDRCSSDAVLCKGCIEAQGFCSCSKDCTYHIRRQNRSRPSLPLSSAE